MQALKKQPPQQITQQLFNGRHLSYQEMRHFAQGILSGVFSESQLGAKISCDEDQRHHSCRIDCFSRNYVRACRDHSL